MKVKEKRRTSLQRTDTVKCLKISWTVVFIRTSIVLEQINGIMLTALHIATRTMHWQVTGDVDMVLRT